MRIQFPDLSALRRGWALLGLAILAGLWISSVAEAQQGPKSIPILTIESDRVFSDTLFGKRIASEIEEKSKALAAENRKIEGELTEEEQALTIRREQMAVEDFRVLANAFDDKVQTIRLQQERKARLLVEQSEAGRVAFLRAAQPVLGQIMQEAGASVILERTSVFFSSNASDITDLAISRIDEAIGDGLATDDQP